MDENAKKVMESIGAIAEMALVFFRAAIGAGATPEEGMALTRAYMEASLAESRRAEREKQQEMEE